MNKSGAEDRWRLTSNNLIRLNRGSSLTPTASTPSGTFLSSEASTSCLPLDERIEHQRKMVRFYMERLLALKPEGAKVVLGDEIQTLGRDEVCLKANLPRPSIPWDNGMEVLGFWKRKRWFFSQELSRIRNERSGTPLPSSPDLSDLQAEHRLSVARSRRWPAFQHEEVEKWLCAIQPGKLSSSCSTREIALIWPVAPSERGATFKVKKHAPRPRRAAPRTPLAEPQRRSRRSAKLPPEFRPLASRQPGRSRCRKTCSQIGQG